MRNVYRFDIGRIDNPNDGCLLPTEHDVSAIDEGDGKCPAMLTSLLRVEVGLGDGFLTFSYNINPYYSLIPQDRVPFTFDLDEVERWEKKSLVYYRDYEFADTRKR